MKITFCLLFLIITNTFVYSSSSKPSTKSIKKLLKKLQYDVKIPGSHEPKKRQRWLDVLENVDNFDKLKGIAKVNVKGSADELITLVSRWEKPKEESDDYMELLHGDEYDEEDQHTYADLLHLNENHNDYHDKNHITHDDIHKHLVNDFYDDVDGLLYIYNNLIKGR